MTNEEFNENFHGIIGPAYRGARYPEFEPCGINESAFADQLRVKCADIDVKGNGELYVNWCSQEPFRDDDKEDFNDELVRCAECCEYEGKIHVHLHDRDGYRSCKYELEAGV